MISSLLTLLRQTIALESYPLDCIGELIIGEQPAYENIHIATTRVPTFGIELQQPSHGYRRLGAFTLLCGEMGIPPPHPDPIVLDRELLAMKNNSVSQNFLQSWGPLGVVCDTHFIVIFYKPPTAVANMTHLFALDSYSSGASHALSSGPASQNSPASRSDERLQAWVNTQTGGSDDSPQSQSIISRAESPASAAFAHTSQTTTSAIAYLLHEFKISESCLKAAKFNSGERVLLAMVTSHRAMVQILNTLGLLEKNMFSDAKSVTFRDGQVFSATDIVKEFRWSLDSFRHKCAWYGWAEHAATQLVWKGPIPSRFFDLNF
jgi:hypothetical protein